MRYRYIVLSLIFSISVSGCLKNEVIYSESLDGSDVSLSDTNSEDAGIISVCNSEESGVICIGVSAVKLTPEKYEMVKSELLSEHEYCPEKDGKGNCGVISQSKWKGLSSKWKSQFFYDCGTDRICPEDPEYKGPDEDGSEGDGVYQGYWIAGYNNSTPMMGVHDDIWARTVVLRHNSTTVAIVSMDFVGFFKSDVDRIRTLVKRKAPSLDMDGINIMSTHSHASIDTMGLWGPEDPFGGLMYETGANDDFIKDVANKVADSIVQAGISMQKGRIRAITERVGIEQMANDVRDPFIIDDNMSVIVFESLSGDRLATMINWGDHPEMLGGITNYISSDWVHYLRQGIEEGIDTGKKIPASGGMAMYIQGAQGGMITPLDMDIYDDDGNLIKEQHSYKAIRQIGYNIARKAYELSVKAPYIDNLNLFYKNLEYRIPLENKYFWMMFDMGWLRDRPKWKIDPQKESWIDNVEIMTEVSLMRIGDIEIQCVPGELFPELAVGGYREPFDYSFGHKIIRQDNEYPPDLSKAPEGPYIRDIMKGKVKLISVLCNDSIGYLVPEYDFELSDTNPYLDSAPGEHYEETRSIGKKQIEIMLENIRKLYE